MSKEIVQNTFIKKVGKLDFCILMSNLFYMFINEGEQMFLKELRLTRI